MPKATLHQLICRSTKNGLKYDIPKIINSDVGFQLMFGVVENATNERKRFEDNANEYETRIYQSIEHFKKFV